jgi:hypothetical protein
MEEARRICLTLRTDERSMGVKECGMRTRLRRGFDIEVSVEVLRDGSIDKGFWR